MPSMSASEGVAPDPQKRRRYRMTVRGRLTATYTALVLVVGIVMLGAVYLLLGVFSSFTFAAPLAAVQQTSTYVDATSIESASVPALPATPADAAGAASDGLADTTTSRTTAATATLDAGLLAVPGQTTGILVSSRDDLQTLLLVVGAALLLVLAAVGAWIGWIVSGRMLRPLKDVGQAVDRAGRGYLDHRVALTGPRDELTDLADRFDVMLGELEQSFAAQGRFAANASHELRTPLATTRAMLDIALQSAPSEQRALLERLRLTNERSITTVESLLDLSEIENGTAAQSTLAVGPLVAGVVTDCAAEAAERDVRIDVDIDAVVIDADEHLLRHLTTNLVHNALRHNHAGGTVSVSVHPEGEDAVLCVSNTGLVLTDAQVALLPEPFHRGTGRTADAAARGRGLGLSIVSAIVRRHEGTLLLTARPDGGLTARVTLPVSARVLA